MGTTREPGNRSLIAYQTSRHADLFPVSSGLPRRNWMDSTPNRFANRCLPMLIANQAGWEIRSPVAFEITWDGTDTPSTSLAFTLTDGPPDAMSCFSAHFGCGILTFHVPYLFRTPPGLCLSVRGGPNEFIENLVPLEGIVETAWATASFTMNWRLLRPDVAARIEIGTVLCFLQPLSLATMDSLEPELADIGEDESLNRRFRAWWISRLAFNLNPERTGRDWQGEYFRGADAGGSHRRRMHLRTFKRTPP